MHHFFVPPDWIEQDTVRLRAEVARQVRTVLRMQPGDAIVVLDNSGLAYQVQLTTLDGDTVTGAIIARGPAPGEPAVSLTLYQALLKKDNFEWVLQKATELGVSRFVPLLTERTVADRVRPGKATRWQRILVEAAEQSRRGRVPLLVEPMSLAAALDSMPASTLALLPWEAADDGSLAAALPADRPAGADIALLIGPEGGFAAEEVERARGRGARIVTLGPRILRAETAAIAAVALVMSRWGEMG